MNLFIGKTPREMGDRAAKDAAALLNAAIAEKGSARLLLSTGASQFEMMEALVKEPVDWSKVTMFHLDEYVALPESHIASFRKYLKERFVAKTNVGRAVFVNGEGDVQANIAELTREVTAAPIDVALIGIGENGHIAFNDPPADFETTASYIVVNLDQRCRMQQVGEGWFENVDAVPAQAISMTVHQIMQSEHILSVVPHAVKAEAVRLTLTTEGVTNMVPATILKTHKDWNLYLDAASASQTIR